jgi:hypothetical protein
MNTAFSSPDFSVGRGRYVSSTAASLVERGFSGRHGAAMRSRTAKRSALQSGGTNIPSYLATLMLATTLVVVWAALCAI